MQRAARVMTRIVSLPVSLLDGCGQTVKLEDLICWRFLDGRPCSTPSQHKLASRIQVVIVPIPAPALDTPLPAPSSAASSTSEVVTRDTPSILEYAHHIERTLTTAGISAHLDTDTRVTPGAKFNKYENIGVPLRLEVGAKELTKSTCTLAVSSISGISTADVDHVISSAVDQAPDHAQQPSAGPQGHQPRKHHKTTKHHITSDLAPTICRALLSHLPSSDATSTTPKLCPKLHITSTQHPHLCAAHIRHQIHLGRPCHCRQGHISLPDLKALIEALYQQQTGTRPVTQWHNDEPTPQHTATLLVSNIPTHLASKQATAALYAAFQPFSIKKVKLAQGAPGYCRGFAHVVLADPDAADSAVAATDGQLQLGGTAVAVSFACGRADLVFPHLPMHVRCRMRIDAVASYSVTDQYIADSMTELLARAAEVLCMQQRATGSAATASAAAAAEAPSAGWQRGEPASEGSTAAGFAAAAEQQAAAGAAASSSAASGTTGLLPLVVTDGTACCGGNTLSLAKRFATVQAVELDEERCQDVLHNMALAGLEVAQQGDSMEGAGTSAAAGPAGSSHVMPGQEAAGPGAFGESAAACSSLAAGLQQQEGQQVPAAGSGRVVVHHGDYTQLCRLLQQQVVFMDPPWGGPQYSQQGGSRPAGSGAGPEEEHGAGPTGAASGAAVSAGDASSSAAINGGSSMRDLWLGSTSVAQLCAQLLSRSAAVVAVKLPTALDVATMCTSIAGMLTALDAADAGAGGATAADVAAGGRSQPGAALLPAAAGVPRPGPEVAMYSAEFGSTRLLLLGNCTAAAAGGAAGGRGMGAVQQVQQALRAALASWPGRGAAKLSVYSADLRAFVKVK